MPVPGRTVLMETLLANNVSKIFGNPGTTESPLYDALAEYPQIEYTVALHEGVALAMASFYAQTSGTTGVVSLHVAPGLGNALGMLYCALKANAPLVVTAGQQDTRMRLRNPILGHDLVSMAAPLTKWSVQVENPDEMADVLHRAFKVASDPPAGPVFVSLPINVLEQQTTNLARPLGQLFRAPTADPAGISALASVLGAAKNPAIIVGDEVARAGAGDTVLELAERLGAAVWFDALRLCQRGAVPSGHPNVRGLLAVDSAATAQMLREHDAVLMIGGPFFDEVWYSPGRPFPDQAKVLQIETSAETLSRNHALDVGVIGEIRACVEALLAEIGEAERPVIGADERNASLSALKEEERERHHSRVERARGRSPMPVSVAMAELADVLPANAVVVDEAITAQTDLLRSFDFAGGGDFVGCRGGGIGQGLPGAIGVQFALPDRPVVCVSGDGSAMYSIQALWSAVRYRQPVIFVILANSEYRILKHNMDAYRQRFETGSNQPYANMDLGDPALGFVELASGFGMQATRVAQPDEFRAALVSALAAKAPYLIEVRVEGKR